MAGQAMVLPGVAPVLTTERLRLRPYRLEDFDAFATYFGSERSRYTDGPVGRDFAWSLFAAGSGNWMLLGYGAWAIEHRESGRVLGLVALNPPTVLPSPELGWILFSPKQEGQGLASEAVRCARVYAFREVGFTRLLSGIHRDNHRSIAMALRLGAKLDPGLAVEGEPETRVYVHPRA
ncbi:MAG: GNAT family N-acetyltransferase [Pseudomonadota bacterium]